MDSCPQGLGGLLPIFRGSGVGDPQNCTGLLFLNCAEGTFRIWEDCLEGVASGMGVSDFGRTPLELTESECNIREETIVEEAGMGSMEPEAIEKGKEVTEVLLALVSPSRSNFWQSLCAVTWLFS